MQESVSRILEEVREGRADVARDLFPVVYRELKAIAQRRLSALPAGQTLQPTALVHEAFIALVDGSVSFRSRAHFFGAAAMAMRDILVDNARRKRALKRGGGERPVELDEAAVTAVVDADAVDVLALEDAMQKLRAAHPRQADVAMLRVYVGASEAEIAALHEVTERTVERDWRFAQAFLRRELAR
ncbi:MAG: sigma-70 family RNA polymerase sigma factor [Myxococcales bacterium]|nr:sigma-70 family RNA polymerase sigma factor [Myxococcales bacterium]